MNDHANLTATVAAVDVDATAASADCVARAPVDRKTSARFFLEPTDGSVFSFLLRKHVSLPYFLRAPCSTEGTHVLLCSLAWWAARCCAPLVKNSKRRACECEALCLDLPPKTTWAREGLRRRRRVRGTASHQRARDAMHAVLVVRPIFLSIREVEGNMRCKFTFGLNAVADEQEG